MGFVGAVLRCFSEQHGVDLPEKCWWLPALAAFVFGSLLGLMQSWWVAAQMETVKSYV